MWRLHHSAELLRWCVREVLEGQWYIRCPGHCERIVESTAWKQSFMQSRGTPLCVHFGVDQTSKYSKTTRSLIAAQKNGSFAPGCRLHEEYLAQAAHKLDLVGVDFIVIASNTAHICYSPMARYRWHSACCRYPLIYWWLDVPGSWWNLAIRPWTKAICASVSQRGQFCTSLTV